ncbi:MAG: metallophosphatase family protein [Chloroflexota bacterium]|nr:metallophosphatase family protein [Chloroflexota bacterium]
MRLAFISDIHANAEALGALADVLGAVDRVICLGDLVGYYCQVNEALDMVRGMNAQCVLGNHDSFLLHGCPPDANDAVRFGIAHADRVITADHRAWLAQLPLTWGGMLGGRTILLAHGSPWRPLADYLYTDSPLLAGLDAFSYDVVAFGQTHRALVRNERRPFLLNPGSVGQSRDMPGYACAFALDTETMAVTRLERPYDPARTIALARHQGAGDWITKHLAS